MYLFFNKATDLKHFKVLPWNVWKAGDGIFFRVASMQVEWIKEACKTPGGISWSFLKLSYKDEIKTFFYFFSSLMLHTFLSV